MRKKLGYLMRMTLLALIIVWQPVSTSTANAAAENQFVKRVGPVLKLHDKEFRFAGSNNYYLMYKSQFMVDDVLESAAARGFRVMRAWGSLDIGNQDGSNSIRGKSDGVYFQYWDGTAPAYNDGPDGLQRLDYMIFKAGQLGLKLVIPFINNWNDFGGMDQYVRWRGGQFHDQFYTDPVIKEWYKNWIAHVLNRTNSYTGVQYKDDPTIMTWELANEPRCLSFGAYPRSGSCTTQTLIAWADEISTYIKSIDNNHLVSVGDEGFYCTPGATDWTENCGEGVDNIAFARLPNIDVMSYHLYPNSWGKSPAWGTDWIKRHIRDARAVGKPAMLGEFGLADKATRNPVYKQWSDAVFSDGGSGALYWILSGLENANSFYPDYDGFTVYAGTPVFTTLGNFNVRMRTNRSLAFPPVADHDARITAFDTAATINPLANDIAYGRAPLAPDSLDLNPAQPEQQTTVSVSEGTFMAQPNGTITFTPTGGFSGNVQIMYTIQDTAGQTSNPAVLTVTVTPSQPAALLLASFEASTEGWAPASWQTNAGTTVQSADFHTQGNYSLKVTTADGGWFGVVFASPIDLTGKTRLKLDLGTLEEGTSRNVALQSGNSFQWCEGTWGFINPNTSAEVEIDLTNLSCGTGSFTPGQVRSIYVWFSGTGRTFYLDNVRAQ